MIYMKRGKEVKTGETTTGVVSVTREQSKNYDLKGKLRR